MLDKLDLTYRVWMNSEPFEGPPSPTRSSIFSSIPASLEEEHNYNFPRLGQIRLLKGLI
jgi:hypothetical protein